MEDVSNYNLLAPTWVSVYRDFLLSRPCKGQDPPHTWYPWDEWTKKTTALRLSYPISVLNRQELKVWEKLHCSPVPAYDKDIGRVAL